MAQGQEISKIVVTPYFYTCRDTLDQFLKRRSYAEERLPGEMAMDDKKPVLMVRQYGLTC